MTDVIGTSATGTSGTGTSGTGMVGTKYRSSPVRGWRSDPVEVLLVEDDDGDAYLVRELLDEGRDRLRLTRVRSIAEAHAAVMSADCVLLDLQLPDAEALEGLRRVRSLAGETPVVVLTGLADEAMGEAAIAAGAQDYLIKGEVDAQSLIRTIRFAVHRRRAELMEAALLEERLHALENTRLERGLLPRPVLAEDSAITVTSRYQPGGARMLLGGDFYDVVADDRGTVRLVVGDVSGHGPDQAALGVELRMAWRAPVMAGLADPDVLDVMHRVLIYERHDIDLFATVCAVTVGARRTTLAISAAGHPAPLLNHDGVWSRLPQPTGPALGLTDRGTWPVREVTMPRPPWSLLLFTDGAVEGFAGVDSDERLGVEGFIDVLRDNGDGVAPDGPGALLDAAIADVTRRNGGPLSDDVALLLLSIAGPDAGAAA